MVRKRDRHLLQIGTFNSHCGDLKVALTSKETSMQ